MRNRQDILEYLLYYRAPAEFLVQELKQFPWGSEVALIVLSREHIKRVLDSYLAGDLDESQVEEWANAVEGRDDIDFEDGSENLLQETIYQLANPLLTEPITIRSAESLMVRLV